jgi:hypothetical protein
VGSGKRLTFGACEEVLSEWMAQDAFVTWAVHPAPWRFEEQLIAKLHLPLNLDKNKRHAFRIAFSEIGAKARERASQNFVGSGMIPPPYWPEG